MSEADHQTAEELAVVLTDLAQRIERLKVLYEQYFMGIERIEPMVARKEVTRIMLTLQQQYIRNTGLRYKFNSMLQKWSTYTTYWNRILREIENGTYVRHLQKAARAAEQQGRALPSEMKLRNASLEDQRADAVAAKLAAAMIEAPAPLKPPPALAAKPPPTPAQGTKAVPPPLPGASGKLLPPVPRAPGAPVPPSSSATPQAVRRDETPPGGVVRVETPPQGVPRVPTPAGGVPRPVPTVPGMSEPELRALHKKYVDARSAIGETAPVRYETLVASLAKQAPKLLEQPGVKSVRFDVVVQDGKAVLKARTNK